MSTPDQTPLPQTALRTFERSCCPVTSAQAEIIAASVFGITGQASELYGECDQNFRLTTDAETYLFKVSHEAEDQSVTDLQTQILTYLSEQNAALAIPTVILARNGQPQARWTSPDGVTRALRLTSFLPGAAFEDRAASQDELRNTGLAMARLAMALRDFRHPAEDRELLWDVQNVHRLRPMLKCLANPDHQNVAATVLDVFEKTALPQMHSLRRQMIHNDINRGNILMSPAGAVTGIIDFGDAVRAPLIQDLAVCGAYHVAEEGDPMANIRVVVDSYETILPLYADEKALLPILVASRMAMSLLIAAWRHTFNPDPDTQATSDRAVVGLGRLLQAAKILP